MGEIKNKFMRMSQSNPLWLDGRSFALVRVNYNQITACERATRLSMRARELYFQQPVHFVAVYHYLIRVGSAAEELINQYMLCVCLRVC